MTCASALRAEPGELPFRYDWAGCPIHSALELPELVPMATEPPELPNNPAIRITAEPLDAEASARLVGSALDEFVRVDAYGHVQLRMPTVGELSVAASGQVHIRVAQQANPAAVSSMIIGPTLGALCHLRSWLALHACTVRVGDRAVSFVGDSGHGKSTMATALAAAGFPLFADDLSVLHRDTTGRFVAMPTQQTIKLHPLHAQALHRRGLLDHAQRIDREHPKCIYRWSPSPTHRPAPMAQVIVLQRENSAITPQLLPVGGSRQLSALVRHVYRPYYVGLLAQGQQHLARCLALSNQVDVFELRYPSEIERLSEVVDRLRQHFDTHGFYPAASLPDVMSLEANNAYRTSPGRELR